MRRRWVWFACRASVTLLQLSVTAGADNRNGSDLESWLLFSDDVFCSVFKYVIFTDDRRRKTLRDAGRTDTSATWPSDGLPGWRARRRWAVHTGKSPVTGTLGVINIFNGSLPETHSCPIVHRACFNIILPSMHTSYERTFSVQFCIQLQALLWLERAEKGM